MHPGGRRDRRAHYLPPMRIAVGTLLALALAATACSSGAGEDAAPRLSRAAYVAAADEVCQTFLDQGSAVEPGGTSPEDLERFLATLVVLAEDTSADLGALAAPEEAASVHDALTTALLDSTEQVRIAQTRASVGDVDGALAALEAAVRIGRSSDAEAKAFGFAVCGSESELQAEEQAAALDAPGEHAAFCDPFLTISAGGALTPDELGPLLDALVAGAPESLAADVERWAALALGVNEAFVEAGATPDRPIDFEDVLPFLDADEARYLEDTASAAQTGTLPDGVVGTVLGFATEACAG